MPRLIDLYDAHKDHRDKFEVLAFHDGTVKDFKELDGKLEKVKKQYWGGKDLPFPILLDSTGATIKTYEINGFPTTILIDPEGKLVGEAGDELLEAKLPALPADVKLARSLDRNANFYFEDQPLALVVKSLAHSARVPVKLDVESLKSAGVGPDTIIPLKYSGMLSLRSVLDLLLRAHDLGWSKDDKGLVIGAKKPGPPPELSAFQRECNARLTALLSEKQSFDFKELTLEDVSAALEQLTSENFVLDPRARKAGKLDPKKKLSGSAKDEPLTDSLKKLLGPLGLTVMVKDEVVIITTEELAKAK